MNHAQGTADNFLAYGLSQPFRTRVHDYVACHLLSTLSTAVQHFMESVPFLVRITPDAAETVLGAHNAGDILESLHRGHTLISYLGSDSGQPMYRFHPLLQDYLQHRFVSRAGQAGLRELHRSCGRFFNGQSDWESAFPRQQGDLSRHPVRRIVQLRSLPQAGAPESNVPHGRPSVLPQSEERPKSTDRPLLAIPRSPRGGQQPTGQADPLLETCKDKQVRSGIARALADGRLTMPGLCRLRRDHGLTWREIDIFARYYLPTMEGEEEAEEDGNRRRPDVARRMCITDNTLRFHISNIRRKLSLGGRKGGISVFQWALHEGIVSRLAH